MLLACGKNYGRRGWTHYIYNYIVGQCRCLCSNHILKGKDKKTRATPQADKEYSRISIRKPRKRIIQKVREKRGYKEIQSCTASRGYMLRNASSDAFIMVRTSQRDLPKPRWHSLLHSRAGGDSLLLLG